MAFIKTIEPEDADDILKGIYDDLKKSRGKIAEVHKIQSLHPKSIMAHMELYMEIMYRQSPLSRFEREMMGTIVSLTNHCEYCVIHHGEAMNHYWKNEERLEIFIANYSNASLSKRESSLCSYAEALTRDVAKTKEDELARNLITQGFSDREVLDATLVIAYFNFVNRIVHGLGVEPEEEGAKGYIFD